MGSKGKQAQGKAKAAYHQHGKAGYYSSKRPVGGKGIFITTVRGKESRCAGEAYDLLDEVADRLYPPERIRKLQDARLQFIQDRARKQKAQQQDGDAGPELDVEDQDGDREMTPAPDVEADDQPGSVQPAALSDDDDDDDDDLEASIQKELAALKAGHGGQVAPTKARKSRAGGALETQGGDGDDAEGSSANRGQRDAQAKKERPRFQSIQTDTECLCFIATAWPYDPVELAEAIISEVQETGQSRTRYIQRITPTTFTCHSLSVDQVEAQSARLIEQTFASWAEANGKTSLTYAIEPSVRSHQAPLSRSVLLPLLGSLCTKLSSPPTISSPVPSRPLLQVRADLKHPDLVLLPTVLRNMYGLSIVEGRLWRGKKFNVAEIAAEKRRERIREEEEEKGAKNKEGGKGPSVVRDAAAATGAAAATATATATADSAPDATAATATDLAPHTNAI